LSISGRGESAARIGAGTRWRVPSLAGLIALSTAAIACEKCRREGGYGVARLIDTHGGNGKLPDWLAKITADCPKKRSVDPARGSDDQLLSEISRSLHRRASESDGGDVSTIGRIDDCEVRLVSGGHGGDESRM
jgi:hypothetical protein